MIRALFLLLSLVLVLPAGAQETRRLTDREDLLGWEGVGRLDMGGRGFCTATLIAPDVILTAAHCAYDRQTGVPYAAEVLTFRAGLSDGRAIAERGIAQVAAHEGFDPAGPLTWSNVRHDVALMRLARPITVSEADPFALHEGPPRGVRVSLASYGMGRSEAISRQRDCGILMAEQGIMVFDCDVTFGSSGSAVLAHEGGRGRVVSVISGMTELNGKRVALGMALPQVVADLKRQLRRDAPVPQAGIKRLRAGSGTGVSGAKFVRPGGS
ncbi:trypsin-like serine peptidase [Lutimaribacter marinistellae]|uniref:Serine protease n=1 Tax=Lutimaribacter marinistellae TaxID=1820329 RepID=A0ABV7TCU0_9RHOB